MESFAVFGMQEYPSRKVITGEPSKEKEPSHQYSPTRNPSLPASPHDSPKASDYKKRKRGRPPLEKDSRLCTNCGTAETPEWRKGPLGPHTLCNACGLQWMKAQKRENEVKSKYEEVRKKNSVMRVLNPHGSAREMMMESHSRVHAGMMAGEMGLENGGELSSRYSPEMDTLPPNAISPPPISSGLQTPISTEAISTLKAMQTLTALSQMNQMNHLNTLNTLNMLSMGNTMPPITNSSCSNIDSPSLISAPSHPTSGPSHYTHSHTVINQYNANLNTYNNNAYNLPPENVATPMARFPLPNPQQIFLPMVYPSPSPPLPNPPSSYSPYATQQHSPMKDYTSSLSLQPTTSTHQITNSHYPTQYYTQFQSHVHQNMHTYANPLLQPSHNLIPNPMTTTHLPHEHEDDPDEASITGGGQM